MNQPTSFKMLPGQTELADIQRDLRFHPSQNRNPLFLELHQVEHFNREGYLKGIRVFTQEEADANGAYFDALLARVLAEGGNSYSISTAHLKHGRVWDLLTHPKIVGLVKDLLGENVIGSGFPFLLQNAARW